MRLDPVYLVAPEPKPPRIPTRRAFLFVGAAFAAGTALGGACGYAAGSVADARPAGGEPDGHEADPALPPPSGDTELDELRRLATVAPIEELIARWQPFLGLLGDTYPDDATLWRGAQRIGEHVLSTPSLDRRRTIALWLAQVIAQGPREHTATLEDLALQLQRVR